MAEEFQTTDESRVQAGCEGGEGRECRGIDYRGTAEEAEARGARKKKESVVRASANKVRHLCHVDVDEYNDAKLF